MEVLKDVTALSDAELIAEINVSQKRTGTLFVEMASRISKKTEGESFVKDENLNVAEYWLKVGLDHPSLIAPICDMDYFAQIVPYFKTLVEISTQDAQMAPILKKPHDAVSKDCSWFISYIRTQVMRQQSNPIYKLIMQKEPNQRKSTPKELPPTPPVAWFFQIKEPLKTI